MLGLRQQDPIKKLRLAALHLDGREILDLAPAHFLGVVLDVEPCELGLRKTLRKGEKPGPVFAADVAPFGAQAGHGEFAGVHTPD